MERLDKYGRDHNKLGISVFHTTVVIIAIIFVWFTVDEEFKTSTSFIMFTGIAILSNVGITLIDYIRLNSRG